MNFLSAKPLHASVAGTCDLSRSDPTGLSGMPTSPASKMISLSQWKPFSPNCVKWIATPIFSQNPDGSLFQFHALDALGQWWTGSPLINKGVLFPTKWPGDDSRGWLEKAIGDVADAVIKYGLPILAAALAATGVGTVGALALLAWRNIAMGQSLTEAVMNAQQAKLAPFPSSLEAFNQGLDRAKAGLSEAAFQAAIKALPSASTSTGPRQAFTNAVQLVRAKQVQDLILGGLATKLPRDETNRIKEALDWGAPLADVMTGIRGKPGDKLLIYASERASNFVAANVATPAKINAALASPATLKTFVPATPLLLLAPSGTPSGAPSSGSGGGSSGPGLGTVAVMGVGGFFAWKWWSGRHGH